MSKMARINRIMVFVPIVSKDHYPVYPNHPGNPVKFFECGQKCCPSLLTFPVDIPKSLNKSSIDLKLLDQPE
jgi:hypothetical protein